MLMSRSLVTGSRAVASLVLCAAMLLSLNKVAAFETDQYNLPPRRLADIGDEVSQHVAEKLGKAVEEINAEIAKRQICLTKEGQRERGCGSQEEERARLAYLRSSEAVATAAYQRLGAGMLPFTKMGTWMDSHHFQQQPARYRTSYWKSIFIFLPHIAFTISPTVRMYGSEFGTDKIAHIFQQGYTYYQIYNRALSEGATPSEAEAKAIRWGQKSERTFFGTWVSGVYSNADLFANYAGMKFYQGLTAEVKIGETKRPPMLVLKDGQWTFNEDAQQSLLKSFISNHLNEALNPSVFTGSFGLRSWVRRTVKKRSCKQWRDKYPGLSQADVYEDSQALRLWYGEDYGFTDSDNFITIANTCFENQVDDSR
jgi:hypothetical protein